MNVLFVCSRNEWRSRTAETIFKNNGHHQVRSAGTQATARIRLSQSMIDWADIIFAMEQQHKKRILQDFSVEDASNSVLVLDIPDDYPFMDEELVEVLQTSMKEYFGNEF